MLYDDIRLTTEPTINYIPPKLETNLIYPNEYSKGVFIQLELSYLFVYTCPNILYVS